MKQLQKKNQKLSLVVALYRIINGLGEKVGRSVYNFFVRACEAIQSHIDRRIEKLDKETDSDLDHLRRLRQRGEAIYDLADTDSSSAYQAGLMIAWFSATSPITGRCLVRKAELRVLRAENGTIRICSRMAYVFGSFSISQQRAFISRLQSLAQILDRPDTEHRPYELLIWLVTHSEDLDEHLGDHYETFDRRATRYGFARAVAWSRRQAFGLAWRRVRAVIAVISFLSGFLEWLSRHT